MGRPKLEFVDELREMNTRVDELEDYERRVLASLNDLSDEDLVSPKRQGVMRRALAPLKMPRGKRDPLMHGFDPSGEWQRGHDQKVAKLRAGMDKASKEAAR